MEPFYSQKFFINDMAVDRYGFAKPSALLFFAQEVAGQHCRQLQVDYDTLAGKGMFWAVIRHRMVISRTPRRGQTIRVDTWPMPTSRAAFPRSVVGYDEEGNECFRSISLWVLMDMESRSMILPGKSGILVDGILRGGELAAPGSIMPGNLTASFDRTVCYTDLDRNGHMNNTRYLDWIDDLFPSDFHRENRLEELTVCYYAEGLEGQLLRLHYGFPEAGLAQVDIARDTGEKSERVFAARLRFRREEIL